MDVKINGLSAAGSSHTLTDQPSTPDVVRVGDGTNQLGITASKEAKTSDATAQAAIGTTSDAAPASDTATASLNGRLQRIAQRLTSLIALLPASLGQKTMANSLAVVLASDQGALATTDASNGSVSGGTAGTKSVLSGGIFNTSLPTLTTGQQAALQVDSSGRQIIAPLANSSIVKAQLQDNAGTAVTVGQKTMSASLPVAIASDQGAVPASQSGTWNIGTVTTVTGVTTVSAVTAVTAVTSVTNPVNTQAIPQSGSTNANSSAATTALAASLVIKASAGRLYQLSGVNTKTSAQYIQVFNSASVPADTTVPILLAYVPAGANFSFDFNSIGRYFSTGITVTNSSTAATKTIGSADCWFNAEYL